MKLRMLLTLVVSFGVINASENLTSGVKIPKSAILGKSALGKARLMRDQEGFKVVRKGRSFPVDPTMVEAPLRTMNDEQLGKYLTVAKIAVSKTSDKNFVLRTHVPGQGGGVFGAWLGSAIGYGAVTFAGHATIHIIGACTGPWYGATVYTLTQMCAAPIHAAATTVGVGLGIAAGVTTGPV